MLITSEAGCEKEIMNELKKIKQVKEVHKLYGVYDIITILETKDMDELDRLVWYNIRRLDKVRSTVTMIVHGSI